MSEPKKTDAWMPLWIGAYLADTMRLTTIQHGAYLLLLMAYWRDEAALPDDDDELRAITKTEKSEWKKMRPVLAKFFVIGEGRWWHKRVEEELAAAKVRASKASSKARAAADARWGNAPKQSSSNAPSMQQALHKDVLDECPTSHTNTIGIGIPPFVAKELHGLNTHNAECVLTPGEICKSMKAQGVADVNPGHPDLLMLLEAGATAAEFEGAAMTAVAKHKGFAYALGTLKGTRKAAAQTLQTLHTGPLPAGQTQNRQEALEAANFAAAQRFAQQGGAHEVV